jgi:hypothetical protein
MSSKPKAPKPTAPDEPRRGFINVGRRLTWAELYGRPQTAVGIEPDSPWAPCEVLDLTAEQLRDHYLRLQEEKAKADHKQRDRDREAARARA